MTKSSRNQQILSERLAVSFSFEQMRWLEQIARVSAELGNPLSLAEIVRTAVNQYLARHDLEDSSAAYHEKFDRLANEIAMLRMMLAREFYNVK